MISFLPQTLDTLEYGLEQMETLVGMVTDLDLVQYRTNSKSRKAHIRVKPEPRDKFFLKFPSKRKPWL